MNKICLGGSVYVEHDPGGLILTTENEAEITNLIVLEPGVFDALVLYVDRLIEGDTE